jgi:UDPglucose--hexose-1-phosphate uridylyltransferase
MNNFLENNSHRRYNILTGEWILVSPHRSKRPWQGQNETVAKRKTKKYHSECYLCPGNTRVNGEQNPDYKDVFIFQNDFAALKENYIPYSVNEGLLKAESESGICRVICFSPDHSKSLADMKIPAITEVIEAWCQQYEELGQMENINYIQIFENKGAVMGCSNPHPHGQIWSQSVLPNEIVKKDKHQKKYFNTTQRSILKDYLTQELDLNERVIYKNDSFVVITPFWAIWPFETMILPKKHYQNITQLSKDERVDFAEAISIITKAYDKLFDCSFPYSSGIHQAPTNNKNNNHWHWHMSFYPPLLRSATVKKFMVGYEMFGMPQRDITAEQAAKKLQSLIG